MTDAAKSGAYEWCVRCDKLDELWSVEDSEGTEAGAHYWASPEHNNCWLEPPHPHTVMRRPIPEWEPVRTYAPIVASGDYPLDGAS